MKMKIFAILLLSVVMEWVQGTAPPTSPPTCLPTYHPSTSPTYQPSTSQPTLQPFSKPSSIPSSQPSHAPSAQPASNPSSRPSTQPTMPSSQPSSQPSSLPSAQPSIAPSSMPSTQPTMKPSLQPFSKPTSVPSNQPISPPSSQPSASPSAEPTMQPSSHPTARPSAQPSTSPSVQPSSLPSSLPSSQPSSQPSCQPSSFPTSLPSNQPTTQPSCQPSSSPSSEPSSQPSSHPSCQPSSQPSSEPSSQPSAQPSSQPTIQPSLAPSCQPTSHPTSEPSTQPSQHPTTQPSSIPTLQPSSRPTGQPTLQPSSSPTSNPTNPTSAPSSSPTAAPSEIPPCPAGTRYVRLPSSYLCIECPAGTYAPARSAVCIPCAAGSFAAFNGTGECQLCPIGFYQPAQNSLQCTKCRSGYVTGALGSLSRSSCVSPTVNFITGGVALGMCILCSWVYLGRGRMVRIALHRRYILVKMNVILVGAVQYMMDLTMLVGAMMNKIQQQQPQKTCEKIIRFFKYILFIVLSFLLMAGVIVATVLYYFFRSMFNALLIWRGYKNLIPSINFSFLHFIGVLIETLQLRIPFNVPWRYLLYPFVFVITKISEINIDLSAVQVTCLGAQASGYLFINLVVTGFIVLIIASDWQIYWTTAWQRLLSRTVFLLSNRFYVGYARGSAFYHAATALALWTLPEPKKWIQYALGFVSLQLFFSDHGRSPSDKNCDATSIIPVDSLLAYATTVLAACMVSPVLYVIAQVVVPSFRITQKYDSSANTLMGRNMRFMSQKSVAQILTDGDDDTDMRPVSPTSTKSNVKGEKPSPTENENDDEAPCVSSTSEKTSSPNTPKSTSRRSHVKSKRFAHQPLSQARQEQLISVLSDKRRLSAAGRPLTFSQGNPSLSSSQHLSSRSGGDFDTNSPEIELPTVPSSPTANAVTERSVFSFSGKYFGGSNLDAEKSQVSGMDNNDKKSDEEETKIRRMFITERKWLSYFFSVFTSILALDWFVMRWLSRYVVNWFWMHRKFHVDAVRSAIDSSELVMDDSQREELLSILEEASSVKIPSLPVLLLPMVHRESKSSEKSCKSFLTRSYNFICNSSEQEQIYARQVIKDCKAEERVEWLFYQEEFLSYNDLMELTRRDMIDGFPLWCDTRDTSFALPLLWAGLLQWFWPAHLLFSPHGRHVWLRVLRNYCQLALVSLGIWTDSAVEDFRLYTRYDDFKRSLSHMSTHKYEDTSCDFVQDSKKIPDLFGRYMDDTDDDDKQQFLHYLASNISSRVVLLQLVPMLTLWSVVTADIAACPICVWSPELLKRLPPLIVRRPFVQAQEILERSMQNNSPQQGRPNADATTNTDDSTPSNTASAAAPRIRRRRPPTWMVWVLGQKIFFTESRLVQFAVSMVCNFMAFALLFLPKHLFEMGLIILLIVMLILGMSVGLYAIMLLHRFLFPNDYAFTDEEEEEGEEEKEDDDDEASEQANISSSDEDDNSPETPRSLAENIARDEEPSEQSTPQLSISIPSNYI